MNQDKAILLIEQEEQVIKDVRCSLKLIDIPLLTVADLPQALTSIEVETPLLILLRLKIEDTTAPELSLARELITSDHTKGVPVVVLCTESEKDIIKHDLPLFSGIINLPLAFPTFINEIRTFINQSQKIDSCILASSTNDSDSIAEKMHKSASDLHHNLAVLYGVQAAVFDKLKNERILETATEADLLLSIAEATRIVCASFDINKIL